MSQDTNVENLIINKLTRAQYESIATPDPTQLYFITDEVISSADVIAALGYTPYNATNPAGYISGITSSDVTTALGYTPENASNKVTSISSSSTNTQYPSAKLVYDQLAGKQPTLVSGTNIKTVNNNSLLGSGNINIDSLPSQTGQSGKFLTTNGTTASWAAVDALPSQSGQSGKYLTTNGTTASWDNIPTEIPTQTGNSGKFLTTNGSTVSWATVDALPSQTSQSGKFLTTNGTSASWASISVPTKISDLTDDTSTYPIDQADTLTGLTATITELNYVDGVTSAIQTQLNGKYDVSNPAGYISGITSSDVTTALGYTPYDATNPDNYITASALNGYATEVYVNNGLATKQDALVSGTNIKTINDQSLLGSGNIDIQSVTSGNGINIDAEDSSIDLIQQDAAATEKYTWSDLTINSNLTNTDNVISNFANNRYITMPNESLTVQSSEEMEFQVRFKKTGSSSTEYLYCASKTSSNDDRGLVIYISSGTLYVRNATTNKLSYSGLALNIFYTLNIQYKNGNLSGTITDENGTTQALTVVSSGLTYLIVSDIGRFGNIVRTGSDQYLRGAIDLNQTFIKVNDTLFHATVTGSPAQIVAKATNNLYGLVKPDGTTITVNNGVISSSSDRNVGEIIQSSLPLTDAGLHLLDGTRLSGDGIYGEFVDYIAELYTQNPTANYFTDETTWQQSITDYGSCGKFVYDSTLNTVRLPKVSDILQGTTDVNALGDLVEAGLPNITGTFGGTDGDKGGTSQYSGVFYNTNRYYGSTTSVGGDDNPITGFNASRSSSTYGNSTTVQPQTIKAFVYIVIANSSKTDIQVDIDQIATDINGKADTDLTNITDTGYIKMAGAGMPSGTYIDLTLGANGTRYTAPANGYYTLYKIASGTNQYIQMCNVGYNNEAVTNMVIRSVGNNDYIGCTMPCAKGQQITVNYTLGGNTVYFRFVYAQGSESEAN